MKTLKNYIEEAIGHKVYSFNGVNNKYQDSIEEALTKSFPTDKLIDKISDHYKINKKEFNIIDGKGENKNFCIQSSIIYKYLRDNWLINTLNTFGYYFTTQSGGLTYFEPIFSENITDIIQDDCNGKIYKVVSKEILEKIKQRKGICVDKDELNTKLVNGSHSSNKIIRKQSNKMLNSPSHGRINDMVYRYFFSRTFFFAASNKEGLKDGYNEVVYELSSKNKDYYVLEVDISNYNVNCYIDNYAGINYDKEKFYFLYINAFFPIELIKIYEADEFEQFIS